MEERGSQVKTEETYKLQQALLSERTQRLRLQADLDRARMEQVEAKVATDKKKNRRKLLIFAGAFCALAIMIFSSITAFFSLFDKQFLSSLLQNTSALFSIVGLFVSSGAVLLLSAITPKERAKSDYDLYEVDQQASEEKKRIELDIVESRPNVATGSGQEGEPDKYLLQIEISDVSLYLSSLVKYLNAQIDQAEKKASILLVTGKMYVRRGIYFYIFSIFAWQAVGYALGGITTIMIIGMGSCTLVFLVIEFLASWFLRQYKSYVESAHLYARTKTHFDSNMLSYLAIREYQSDSGADSLQRLLDVLQKPVAWPSTFDRKDFNHMLQMFESLSLVADKAKAAFSKKPESGE